MEQTRKQLKSNKVQLTGAEKAVIIEALKFWAQEFELQIKEANNNGRRLLFASGWPTGQADSIIMELEKQQSQGPSNRANFFLTC